MKHFIQTLTGKITIVILLIVFPVIFMVYQKRPQHTAELAGAADHQSGR